MANDEVLGPRKTMFVLVIVVGCFAVLWPRILSPLILGHSQEQLKPNQYDREAGCCEVMFETEIAVLELVNEVCSSAIGVGGKLSPHSAAECRKAVNETCGVDIVAFLKRSDNVGKTTKMLLDTIKNSNSSCLKEHFGVQLYNLNTHPALNSWTQQDTLKQERSPIRGMGPHPALRERGRAIPPGVQVPPLPRAPTTLPPHIRVRTSPLSVYYEQEVKPPPIPGMRPPLGSPGGPVPAPKSSMGFVMPIYTICIIVFFVYTLSKILFKRTGSPYDSVAPDPHFRRRVFRDESKSSPDKLGPKERDAIVTAISGLVAEVQQQMEASDAQCQQRQEAQDSHARPYTNGTILLNSGPVQIITSEFQEPKENSLEEKVSKKDLTPEANLVSQSNETTENIETVPNYDQGISDDLPTQSVHIEEKTQSWDKECVPETEVTALDPDVLPTEPIQPLIDLTTEDTLLDETHLSEDQRNNKIGKDDNSDAEIDISAPPFADDTLDLNGEEETINKIFDNIALSEGTDLIIDKPLADSTKVFIKQEKGETEKEEKQSTPELLEEALKEDSLRDSQEVDDEQESPIVKVLGMEVTTHAADGSAWPGARPPVSHGPAPQPAHAQKPPHEADEVKSIFLETEIPQQARVLVAEFAEDRTEKPKPTKHAPLVVSGKMTLSLIQDVPRETPERDPESVTVDDFTTASTMTQLAEKEGDMSEEEIEEEIEIEEIEEEIEEEEEVEPNMEPKTG